MPIGYVLSVVLLAWCTLFAVRPPRPSRSSPSNTSFWFGYLVNELPFVAGLWLGAATMLAAVQGDLASPLGVAGATLAVITVGGLVIIVRRALAAGPVLERALGDALGPGRRDIGVSVPRRRRWLRILLWPWPLMRRDVDRIADVAYADRGRFSRLDVYRPRGRRPDGPTLIHLHGGAFRSGGKSREARPLLHRLASHGWVCVSANYRLAPHASFPDQLIDAKQVIAWVREHGPRYGADPGLLLLAGSSAGAHLAAIAALTANDPTFQPGFEDVDTSAVAAIALYGYFGGIDTTGPPSSPHDYVRHDAPPFFVAHGDTDTIVIVEDARSFVNRLRATSVSPVVYAELPGAQHDFDLFHSIRFEAVIDAIEQFAAAAVTRE